MSREQDTIDLAALRKAQAHPTFGSEAWLTFYLVGSSEGHASMRDGLMALDASNLDGADGGFVYAKLPTPLDQSAIEQQIRRVRELAEYAGIRIDVIDLDASHDVEKSKFFTLWTAG